MEKRRWSVGRRGRRKLGCKIDGLSLRRGMRSKESWSKNDSRLRGQLGLRVPQIVI